MTEIERNPFAVKPRRKLRTAIFSLVAILFLLVVYRQVLLSQIPQAENKIPLRLAPEKIPVPKRPGTQSVRIVGPPIKTLKFEIDFRLSPEPLDWTYLERIDKRADVAIAGTIDEQGYFLVTRLRDRGHPKAGSYIRRVVSSWKFLPYKTGPIRFYFNVPTRLENMKIQIDVSDLTRNAAMLASRAFLKNGTLCYVTGLHRQNIMINR